MAFVSTLGASNANSFLSVAAATTLLNELPVSAGITAWIALTATQKEQTLVAATMSINPLRYKGRVATAEQSLSWPRLIKIDGRQLASDDLPLDFEVAVAYMAAYLGSSGGYTAVKYKDQGDVPQTGIDYIPPFAMDILSRYILDASFNQPYVTRSSTARIDPYYANASFRPSRIRVAGDQVFPARGGWGSNPL